ncbi:1,3-beta-glucan synthase subunit FKS1-like, domain-1, partial [Dillenia turbinata]
MGNPYENWERLVRSTLQREQLRQTGAPGHERTPSGIAGAVPPSLGRTSSIELILQAADEIQSEAPNVARILCEQAYSMAQNLDPTSEGRGVLQFKTGLMSVIKQKLAKKDGARIDRNRDVERLWEFYQQYKRRHRVEDIQREEQKWRESGVFSTNMGELELRSVEMKKVIATLRALIEVMEALSEDGPPPDGVGRLIMEELRRIKKSDATLSGELAPYNIVPLDAPSITNVIGVFPEIRGAISAIRYTEHFPKLPDDFEVSGGRDPDMFDLLECVFGFQKDNIRNQREHVILTIANAQTRLGIPVEANPKIDEKAITEVFLKVLDNYIKWCKYLRIRLAWNSLEAINRDRKLFLASLYFLVWGEAANVRFLPECICYIFHQMAKELDHVLDHGEARPAVSCRTESGSVSFLEQVIHPIYQTIAKALAIIAFNNGSLNLDTFKTILSVGPSFAVMNFIESCLDVLLMFGAYTSARGMAISRLVIRKVLDERNKNNGDSSYFRIYILVLGIYAGVRLVFAMFLKFPAFHVLSEMSDQPFFQFFKWIYQIKPLVDPSKIIVNLYFLQYSWHDLVSKNNHNALTIASLWAPVVAIYLMDIHIWYTILSAIIGGIMGARARLGEIRSIEMIHKRFETFPEAFVKNLVSPQTKRIRIDGLASQVSQDVNKSYAAIFSPFWNDIIKSLREEDYINEWDNFLERIGYNESDGDAELQETHSLELRFWASYRGQTLARTADGKIEKEFYSKLVKADVHGRDQEIYSIKLPGDPKLGEGKPENQNHAIIFTRGEAIQTIDMNQ